MGLFDVKNMSYAYGSKEVLHALNFSLEPGLFYGLVGPNGSGKTTLLDLLLGNLLPKQGSIMFKGKEISQYPRRSLALEVALVPQDFKVNFDFTVMEVVMMGRHPHIPRFANPSEDDVTIVERIIKDLGIDRLKDRFITQLSGGEKQRVIVARALAQNTPTLILDEATSNLDIHHSIQIFKEIKNKISQRTGTVIAAIHDLNFASAYCDAIILIDKGELLKIGPPQDVLTPEQLKDIFNIESHAFFDQFSNYQISYKY